MSDLWTIVHVAEMEHHDTGLLSLLREHLLSLIESGRALASGPEPVAGAENTPNEVGGSAVSQSAELVEHLSGIIREINGTIQDAQSTNEEMRLLYLRGLMEQLQDEWREKAEGEHQTSAASAPVAAQPQAAPGIGADEKKHTELPSAEAIRLPNQVSFQDLDDAVTGAVGMMDLLLARLLPMIEAEGAAGRFSFFGFLSPGKGFGDGKHCQLVIENLTKPLILVIRSRVVLLRETGETSR